MKRQKVVPPVRKGDAAAAAGPAHDDVCAAGENREQYAEDYRLAQRDARAQQELKLLSALLANKPQVGACLCVRACVCVRVCECAYGCWRTNQQVYVSPPYLL